MQCAKRVLRYLSRTVNWSLHYPRSPTTPFRLICLPLQLSAPFVCNLSFQLRLFVTSAFVSLIFICLCPLNINDAYSLDVFLLKTINQHDSFLSSPLPFKLPRSLSTNSCPNDTHLDVLRYLNGTKDWTVFYPTNEPLTLEGFADADYATCLETRRSFSGYLFRLGGCTIS